MNWASVWIILVYEWRMLARDTRTIMLSVVLPILVMPLLLASAQQYQERQARTQTMISYGLTIVGPQADALRQALRTLGTPGSKDYPFREIRLDDQLEKRLREGVIDVYLQAQNPGTAPRRQPSPAARGLGDARIYDGPQPDVPVVTVGFLGDQTRSISARVKLEELLHELQRRRLHRLLLQKGFPVDPAAVLEVKTESVASDARLTGAMVGPFVTVLLVFLLLGGGSVAAMDLMAGERERGSLETLLTTCARRQEIVAAKQLAVLSVALLIAVIQLANILVFKTFHLIKLPATFRLEFPWPQPLMLALVALPLAVLVAALLLYISGRSTSFKESQLLFFPVFVVTTVLGVAGAIPDLQLRSVILVVPIAPVSVAVREIMLGHYDWWGTTAAALATLAWAAVFMRLTTQALLGEGLVVRDSGDSLDDPRARVGDRVLIWFAVMAAIMMVVPSQFPALTSLQGQVVFLQLLMLSPLLLVWACRAPLGEALALRLPHPLVWPVALLLAPALQVAANGVVPFADALLPIPEEIAREMSKLLVPENVSTWQLILMIAVVPGICEEIAFRGVLLYGLSRRLRPPALVLAVGVLFALIHLDIHRIVPIVVPGVVLTALALVTGSILPGMLVHCGNNASAVLAERLSLPLAEFPLWVYGVAWALVGVCFYVLWRVRTPYPGLRPWRAPRGS